MKHWEDINPPTRFYSDVIKALSPETWEPEQPEPKLPTLTWPGDQPCPVEVGDEVLIQSSKALDPTYQWTANVPRVWLRITHITRGKKGEHLASYTPHDLRPRYMAPHGGVTTSAHLSIDPTAEYDVEAANDYARVARLRAAERDEDRHKQYRAFRERLKDVRASLSPEADLFLMAKLKLTLDEALRGQFD